MSKLPNFRVKFNKTLNLTNLNFDFQAENITFAIIIEIIK